MVAGLCCSTHPSLLPPASHPPVFSISPSFRPISLTCLSTWMKRQWRSSTSSWSCGAVVAGAWRIGSSSALGLVRAVLRTRSGHSQTLLPTYTVKTEHSSTAPLKFMRSCNDSDPFGPPSSSTSLDYVYNLHSFLILSVFSS